MRLGRREAIALGVAAVAAAATGMWWRARQAENGETQALDAASFADLSGRSRQVAEWRGSVVVVNFWATWCAPCREEIPMLREMRDKYREKGLEIVGIAIDLVAKVKEFAKETNISYPILMADAGGIDLLRKLGNAPGGLPYTVFLDRSGRIQRRKLGALRRQELEAWIAELLPA